MTFSGTPPQGEKTMASNKTTTDVQAQDVQAQGVNMLAPESQTPVKKNVDETLVASQKGGIPAHEKSSQDAPGKKEPVVFEFLPSPKTTRVKLSGLISLDDTPLKYAKAALRDLNKEHVAHLAQAYEANESVPPIKVVNTSWGWVIIGGYHRRAALEGLIKAKFADPTTGKVSEAEVDAYHEARAGFMVPVQSLDIRNGSDAIMAAYVDNMSSGLPVADSNRSRFAIYLLQDAKERGVKMTVTEAAHIARVSRVAVQRQMARDAGREGKNRRMPADVVTTPEDLKDVQEYIEQAEAKQPDRLNRSARSLLNMCLNVYDESQDIDALVQYINALIPAVKSDAETLRAALETISMVLSLVEVPDDDEQSQPVQEGVTKK